MSLSIAKIGMMLMEIELFLKNVFIVFNNYNNDAECIFCVKDIFGIFFVYIERFRCRGPPYQF